MQIPQFRYISTSFHAISVWYFQIPASETRFSGQTCFLKTIRMFFHRILLVIQDERQTPSPIPTHHSQILHFHPFPLQQHSSRASISLIMLIWPYTSTLWLWQNMNHSVIIEVLMIQGQSDLRLTKPSWAPISRKFATHSNIHLKKKSQFCILRQFASKSLPVLPSCCTFISQ